MAEGVRDAVGEVFVASGNLGRQRFILHDENKHGYRLYVRRAKGGRKVAKGGQ